MIQKDQKQKLPKRQIIALMNSFSSGRSGGDMVFIEIAKRLKNYKIDIVTSKLGQNLCKENGLDNKFIITTKEDSFNNAILTYIKRIIIGIFIPIDVQKKSILLGTSDFLPDVLPIFVLIKKHKKLNLKWIQHIFHLIPKERKVSFYAQKISFQIIKRYANIIVVDNNMLKSELIKLGFNKQKVILNYPGIDNTYLNKVKLNKSQESKYQGIMLARLVESKGVFDLINIWEEVCNQIPNARLGMIGKGSEEMKIKINNYIKEKKLDKNIDLLGFLPTEKAFPTINNSKVFVFPSHEEGFGIAALEAQLLGLPVIAWNLPIFDEVFPNGMLKAQNKNKKIFAEHIIRLLKDKDFYNINSRQAVKNASRFSWDNTARKEQLLMESIY